MPISPDHTAPTLDTLDTNLMDLIDKGWDIEIEIQALRSKLDTLDKDTDAVFRARNALATQQGQDVFHDIDSFVDAMS